MGELHCGTELLGQLDLILKFIYFVHTWIYCVFIYKNHILKISINIQYELRYAIKCQKFEKRLEHNYKTSLIFLNKINKITSNIMSIFNQFSVITDHGLKS